VICVARPKPQPDSTGLLDGVMGVGFTWNMSNVQLGILASITACFGVAACSAAPVSTGTLASGAASSTNGGAGGGNGGSGAGSNYVIPSTGGTTPTVIDGGRLPRCDADTGKCTCINIAEFGKTGTFGASQNKDGSTAFQDWLNNSSSAHVDVYAGGTVASDRTTITSDLLANYDVIILQSLSANPSSTQQSDYWVFTQPEIDAVTDWVTNKGGAIIALTGYFSDNSYETNPTNQLISFNGQGLTIDSDDLVQQADCPPNPASPANGQQTCYCWGNSIPITDWNASNPIAAGPNPSGGSAIKAVGAFRGRSISIGANADASVVATFNETNGPYAGKTYDIAVSAQVGKGRVFAFGDEWITYNSQWNGDNPSVPAASYENSYDPCYNQQPFNVFQIPQFWYNALVWCAPLVACQLTISLPPGQTPIIY
jgi:hypothetical protein